MTRFQRIQTSFLVVVTIALLFTVTLQIKDRFFADPPHRTQIACHLVAQSDTQFGMICDGRVSALPRSS